MVTTSKGTKPQPTVAELIAQAIQHGDWIRAAMADVRIGESAVRFNSRFYTYTVDAYGALVRLDPSIKKGALAFGLHEAQVERFYGRVCKAVCRELMRRKRRRYRELVAAAATDGG